MIWVAQAMPTIINLNIQISCCLLPLALLALVAYLAWRDDL